MNAMLPYPALNYRPREARVLKPLYLSVQEVSRRYGGPEEGGWYYDVYETVEVVEAYGWRQALAAARRLRREWGPFGGTTRGSVLAPSDYQLHLRRSAAELPEDRGLEGGWDW